MIDFKTIDELSDRMDGKRASKRVTAAATDCGLLEESLEAMMYAIGAYTLKPNDDEYARIAPISPSLTARKWSVIDPNSGHYVVKAMTPKRAAEIAYYAIAAGEHNFSDRTLDVMSDTGIVSRWRVSMDSEGGNAIVDDTCVDQCEAKAMFAMMSTA